MGGSATQNSSIQALNQEVLSAESQRGVLTVSLSISFWITTVLALLWGLGYPWLRGLVFPSEFPVWLYFLLPVSCLLSTFFFWANAFLSATKNYRSLAIHNIHQTFWNTVLFIVGGQGWGIVGACTGLAMAQIPIACLSIWRMRQRAKVTVRLKEIWNISSIMRNVPYPDSPKMKSPWPMVALSLYSVAASQITLVVIRSIMMKQYPINEVGYWEGLQRIGNLWIPVIATILSSHFLPILSQQKNRQGFLRHSIQSNLASGGLVLLFALGLMAFRFQAIPLLFSSDFGPMVMLLPLQLIADILKAVNWSLSHAVLSQGHAKQLIVVDVIVQGILMGGVALGSQHFGWAVAVQVYAAATLVQSILTMALWLRTYRLLMATNP
jgi:O-antigen/teichoic acid export membrane protein